MLMLLGIAGALAMLPCAARAQDKAYTVNIDGDTFTGNVQGSMFVTCKGKSFSLSSYKLTPKPSSRGCPAARAMVFSGLSSDPEDQARQQRQQEADAKAAADEEQRENARLQAALERLRAKQQNGN
jgi:hypothetical protein